VVVRRTEAQRAALASLPQILFVLGKGGVGRSTLATALGLMFAQRGERVLIMEWTVEESIAPWFGKASMDFERSGTWAWIPEPMPIAPGLSVFNYRLREALRGYFVDHLGLSLFYKRVIDGPHMRRLIEAAPGIAELLFIGQLWWMTSLAETEAGLQFDRIVVDAPATGHGASLLDLPATLATIGATGLLALEVQRVVKMMADPARTGALVVSLPEELSVEETIELVPRVTKDLARPPLAAFVNRSVAGLIGGQGDAALLGGLALSQAARDGLETVQADLRARARFEGALREALAGKVDRGVFSLHEQLAVRGACTPREVVEALAKVLGEQLGGGA
jgi:anion-transporting  ArsA/GET3 family ATPase